MNSSLYFTNAEPVAARLRTIKERHDGLQAIVLDASGLDHLDATADHEMRTVATEFRESGIDVLVVNANDEVRAVMDASGLSTMIGSGHFFASDSEALAYLDGRQP